MEISENDLSATKDYLQKVAKRKRSKSAKNITKLTPNIKVGDDVVLKSSGKRLKVLYIKDDNAFCTDGTSESYLCYPLVDLELVIK